MAGLLIRDFVTDDFDHAWAVVALARGMHATVPGTHASLIGKSDTALRDFSGIQNRRFAEAVLFCCKPYSYPDDDSIERGFCLFRG